MTVSPDPSSGPLIVACLRVTDLRPQVDPLNGAVSRDRWGVGLSAADGAALEHAFRVADAWSGRVVAVAVGPSTVEPVLRDALAVGASVLRISMGDPDLEPGDTDRAAEELAGDERGLAQVIAAALEPFGTPALVLCGDRSVDRGTGALPAFLAHELGASQALGLVSLDVEQRGPDGPPSGEDRTLIGDRRLDGGWRERLRVRLPAVCSVEGAGIRLRRASLAGALAAEAAAIPVDRSSVRRAAGSGGEPTPIRFGGTSVYTPRTRVLPAPQSGDPRIRLLDLTGALVAHDPPTLIGPVDAPEAADALIDFLVRHRYLDHSPPPTPTVSEPAS